MRNILINRQLQHLGIDQDQPHLAGRRLVQQAQQHGIDRHRFTGTGSPRHQQMRHLAQIGDHRIAADILTQTQGQGRSHLLVDWRFQHLAQINDLPVLVRDLQTDDRLTGNDFHHPHADYRQTARQILGQITDLTHFDAGCRLDFEAGNNRTRLYRYHLHLNSKTFQQNLQPP